MPPAPPPGRTRRSWRPSLSPRCRRSCSTTAPSPPGWGAPRAEGPPFAPDEPFPGEEPFPGDEFTSQGDEPNPTTLGIISLVFGGAYLVSARLLDRRGFAGTATPFVVVSLAAIPAGIAFLGDDLAAAGRGGGRRG